MTHSQTTRRGSGAHGEQGGSRLNFLIIIFVIAVGAYSTYQYAPTAYNAFLFKDFMQDIVNKAAYPPGQTTQWVESQLRASAKENDLPPEMHINVQKQNGQVMVQVQWSKPIKLPGYVYDYNFDHTAKSSGFINPQ